MKKYGVEDRRDGFGGELITCVSDIVTMEIRERGERIGIGVDQIVSDMRDID